MEQGGQFLEKVRQDSLYFVDVHYHIACLGRNEDTSSELNRCRLTLDYADLNLEKGDDPACRTGRLPRQPLIEARSREISTDWPLLQARGDLI